MKLVPITFSDKLIHNRFQFCKRRFVIGFVHLEPRRKGMSNPVFGPLYDVNVVKQSSRESHPSNSNRGSESAVRVVLCRCDESDKSIHAKGVALASMNTQNRTPLEEWASGVEGFTNTKPSDWGIRCKLIKSTHESAQYPHRRGTVGDREHQTRGC